MGLLDIFQPTNQWAASAPGGWGAQPSPFSQWVNANPYGLNAIGQGVSALGRGMVGHGSDMGGLVSGINDAVTAAGGPIAENMALQRQQQQQAKQVKAAQDAQNRTVQWLQQKGQADLAAAVQNGMISGGDAFKLAMQQAPTGPDYMSVPDKSWIFDKASGKFIQPPQGPMSQPDPQPGMMWSQDGKSQIPVPGGKEAFDREQAINQQYATTDPVKTYQVVRSGYQKIRESSQLGTGAGDISMIFAYMKMLDPTSVVREGEFATAQNAGGVSQTVQNLYNSVLNGQKLTPDMRNQFLAAADKLYQQTAANLSQENSLYSGRAQGWGVDPSHFIVAPQQFPPLGPPDDPLGIK